MSTGVAVLGVFNNIKDRLYVSTKKLKLENTAFRISARLTVAILFLFAGLVTLQNLIGEHIKCIVPPSDDVRGAAVNQYCFIMSTYTVPALYNKTVASEVPAFGVGPHNPEEDEEKYHSYYQWVPFVLFFQAILFMVPHILWKAWEDGRIRAYTFLELPGGAKMRDRHLFKDDEREGLDKAVRIAADTFKSYMYFNYFYTGAYVLCEVLNFVIVVTNIFLTDAFLGNEFSQYGLEVLSFINSDDPETRIDPMNRVFPKVTKCDFRKIGPSGNIIRYDVMCVLALNILNEKIYVFLWFWFIIVAIISGLNLIYRVLSGVLPSLRNRLLLRKVPKDQKYDASLVCNRLGFCDWFLLKRIADNVNTVRFGQFCQALRASLDQQGEHEPSIQSTERSPSSLFSPPPNYESSTLPVGDDNGSTGRNIYRAFPELSSDSLHKPSTEMVPLVSSGRKQE